MKKLLLVILFFPLSLFAKEISYNDWTVNINIDPITDKKTVSMNSVYVSDSTSISSAFFTVGCDSVIIIPFSVHNNLKDYEDGLIKVIFRADKKAPVEMEWEKKGAVFMTNQKQMLHQQIQNSKKFIIRFGDKSTSDFNFPLSGYTKAYERLEKECTN
ncbi:hypothetical protein A9G28_07935 [Gilliamella sp. Fer1-1]|jgi:hypothetical protein|uniref:hypothetical protein n=1 Tax=unclassified Gilliamella TaxID=2685620 RepID=UPI00080E1389|nr:hypothetical protein [Gilliamella apicola]OCG35601.1 hypothetical protein A9G31_07745 [Gilliamella apicola]OCG40563.1 hypothetical protein A9G28_07935 [Gilliamella apicola]